MIAGGRSTRFGRDKLSARVDGTSALGRVVAAVRPLASEVIVSTSSDVRRKELAPLLPSTIRFLLDRPRRWGHGPAGAMAVALDEVATGPVLFVPGDMPWIEVRALRRLVRQAGASTAEVAAPYWQSGETEHLIQWHRSRETLRYLGRPGARSRSRGRASEYLRAVPRTLLVPVRLLSDRPETFSHLTYPSDIDRPSLRGQAGSTARARLVDGAPKRWYLTAHDRLRTGRLAAAARAFLAESRWYSHANLTILANHSLEDAIRAVVAGPAVPETQERSPWETRGLPPWGCARSPDSGSTLLPKSRRGSRLMRPRPRRPSTTT